MRLVASALPLVAAAVTSAALGCSGPVAAVAASPAWATMAAGQSLQLRAMPEDGKGKTLSSRVIRGSSSDTSVARVDTSGLGTGVAAGAATIPATREGKEGPGAITLG